ncbi:hypothetical protein CTAYLR_003320 [Chrysophaeum taylorii]|uniref:Sulfotransferase n=1 Tax=Chrysophaeum taylorii TaxID=2483200 RepID=A0AAD7UGC2_9STRA|nr:hypothetical protein CTAYLR_003320 [Chrysophaeum taylorii]
MLLWFVLAQTGSSTALIVLKNPRSGSSWFVQLLNSVPSVFVTEEILTSKSQIHKNLTLVEAHLLRALEVPMTRFGRSHVPRSASSKKPTKWDVVGFTLSPKRAIGIDLGRLSRRAKVVVYERTNKIKQAIAYYRGRRLRKKCGYNNIREECRLAPKVRVDIGQLETFLVESMAKDRALGAVQLAEYYRVTYEDLIADANATCGAVFRYLGVPHLEMTGDARFYSKATPDDLRSVVSNFDELEAWLHRRAPCLLPHLRETRPGVVQPTPCYDDFLPDIDARMKEARSWKTARTGDSPRHHRRRQGGGRQKKNKQKKMAMGA